MQKLAEICIRRPVFATVLILVLVVFGVFGYSVLGVDRFPKVDIPTITVTTVLPGSAPEEIETEITDKIEEAVNTVSGIDELRSVSAEGVSQVFVSFVLEKDVDVAAQEIRDQVDRILAELPEDVEQPRVEKLDPDAAPVLSIVLSGSVPIRELSEYGDKVLRRQIESVSGVGQVSLVGAQLREINVKLDPEKLHAHDLTVSEVAHALSTQNVQVPGGTLKQGAKEYTLRTLGRVNSPIELSYITVANRNGHTITIGDLGVIEDTTQEAKNLAYFNDTPAVLLNVRKQSGTNTVAVVDIVKERLSEVAKNLPKGYSLEVVRDQSRFIEAATHAVKEHLVLGSILAAVVVLLFLANFRTTLIAALAIPTSIIATFAAMWYMGYTLNVITLLALTLAVGIVIDDAIVVLENIYRYIEEKGYTPFEAARAATAEIGLAVMSITLSLIAVFLPIAFMSGIVGRFMSSFGVTMSFAIAVSLFVSFTLTPMLSARWLRAPKNTAAKDEATAENQAPSATAGASPPPAAHHADPFAEHDHAATKKRGLYHLIETTYLYILRFSMRHRWLIVLICFGALGSVPFLMDNVRKNFLPDDDQSEFEVSIRTPEGTSLEASQGIVARIARDIRGLNGVESTIASTGEGDQASPNQGSVYVKLTDVSERDFDQFKLMNFVREDVLPRYADLNLRMSVSPVAAISGGGNANAAIQFLVSGPDMDKLAVYSEQIVDRLKKIPGAVDVDSSLVVGKPEYGVTIDRAKAGDLGVSVSDIATTLRLLVAGDNISDYNEKGEQYDVFLRANPEARSNVEALSLVTVPSAKEGVISLSDLVTFKEGTGPSQINRLNRRRQVTITANLAPNVSQQGVLDQLNQAVSEIQMEPGYDTALVGQSKELAKAANSFLLSFLMAFIFMYLVIAAQFESWLHPITILLSLPLTLPFALLSLILFNQSLNIFSVLGVMVLFAVVKKNSILQIDHTNQLRAEGLNRYDAIIAANLDRLRPILMTTVAFVAGMFPLLLSTGAGAATNQTISSVVIGGQTLSLLLTLVATPVAYSLFDDLANSRAWKWIGNMIKAPFRRARTLASSVFK